jgi:hypothetical protein
MSVPNNPAITWKMGIINLDDAGIITAPNEVATIFFTKYAVTHDINVKQKGAKVTLLRILVAPYFTSYSAA